MDHPEIPTMLGGVQDSTLKRVGPSLDELADRANSLEESLGSQNGRLVHLLERIRGQITDPPTPGALNSTTNASPPGIGKLTDIRNTLDRAGNQLQRIMEAITELESLL